MRGPANTLTPDTLTFALRNLPRAPPLLRHMQAIFAMEMDMNIKAATTALHANGQDKIDALRATAGRIASKGLPAAASAAERTGAAASGIARSSSEVLARTLRDLAPAAPGLVRLTPLARAAGRFARRHPALLALGGLAIAAAGYAAWRRRAPEAD